MAACGSSPSAAVPSAPSSSAVSLLARVGDKPRGYASVDLHKPNIFEPMKQQAGADEAIKALMACGIDLAKLDRVRVAIGEPLRITAEIDGTIDAKAVTCAAGPLVTSLGVHVVDRPGGVALDYQATPATTSPLAADLAKRCLDRCAILRAGPASRTLWLAAELGDAITVRISGNGIQAGLAAFAAAAQAIPALEPAHIEARNGSLVVHFPTDPISLIGIALAVRTNLFEAFKIPSSSMEPTLHIDDHLFIVKGPLAQPITPGDVLVYATDDDRDYIKRYMGAPGQTLDESDAGMVIDGKVLPGEVVDASYSYEDGEPGHREQRAGIKVREHLGARSYLVLRPEHPRHPGPWKVPPGTAFFVGDSRGNSNDSRYNPATPVDRIKGRAVTIYWAVHDGAPAWDRIGGPIE
jgi:signal peptidase I